MEHRLRAAATEMQDGQEPQGDRGRGTGAGATAGRETDAVAQLKTDSVCSEEQKHLDNGVFDFAGHIDRIWRLNGCLFPADALSEYNEGLVGAH